ncbi:BON domain-containing protein [Microcoleus sp. FACHB-1515]|uniref:BON domain-containing protein n=1 Tax=Cyanophyceae TaxID=3028117 RepID=UPI00168712DF|nr:BON domain-containing protein [Microcoleus sp. FACHB-1515]MBD2089003.1 BON domain-containing protein [Microcoleus sp. FACHB-1515]
MGFLQRLFGIGRNEAQAAQSAPAQAPAASGGESIPPERVGLNGEYDQSGLAKRVALAFDNDSSITDIETLYVAQTGTTVVLKGKVPDQQSLTKMVSVARGVSGATAVDTSQVTIG